MVLNDGVLKSKIYVDKEVFEVLLKMLWFFIENNKDLLDNKLLNVDFLENFYLEKFYFYYLIRCEVYEEVDEMFRKLKRLKGGGIVVYLKDICNII